MPQQAWKALDIGGITPAIDPRRSEGLFALGGKNYVFDSLGPKSAFGNRLLSSTQITSPGHFQGNRIRTPNGDRVFYFGHTTITEWKEETNEFIIIYTFESTAGNAYRWTHGYLNGKIYFCHPSTGILVYDIVTEVCADLVGPGVPEQSIAICVDNGRLIAIDIDFMYWSVQSNGADFTPTLGGAGFQKINERIAGAPIMVTSYGRGVLTWTTGGVMRSEFTGDAEVYRHRGINTELRPINSFCTIKMDDDTVIILDERGLFQSRGEAPEPVGALFNEFLLKYIQKNNLREGLNIRLEWDDLQRFMYISISTSFVDAIYEKAYVYYPAIDKWGTFDEPHYGIFPARIDFGQRADDYFGFIGSDRRLRIWMDTGSRQHGDGTLLPLDASIQVGLIRFSELGESMDQLLEVNQIMIGNALSGDPNVLGEDFNLVPEGQDEDYNILSGAEDLGFERSNYINHKIRILGTIDGHTVFDENTPMLTYFSKAVRHYATTCQGLWHMLELSATEVGESFHCKAFELTASYAGKLA